MSDEPVNHGHNGHGVEFEHEDLSPRGLFAFMIGLAITGVAVYFIITGMYTYLDKYEKAQMTTASPLVKTDESGRIASRAVTTADVEKAFKDNGAPMLEDNEREQLHKFLLDQERQLNSYGWVDEKAGVARIPIEHAMELTAQRGLPVRPDGGANAPAGKSAAAPKALAVTKQ
jgi:hypothetical protein